MPWLFLAAAALFVAFLMYRNRGGRGAHGLDAVRVLADRHRELSRAIAYERVRVKSLGETEGATAAQHLAAMEQNRKALGEQVQALIAELKRRGFGMRQFWLPSVDDFEAEAVAAQGILKAPAEKAQ